MSCKKYGWRGHWFKSVSVVDDSTGVESKQRICGCGLSPVDVELQNIKKRVVSGYSSYETGEFFRLALRVAPFVIGGLAFFVLIPNLLSALTDAASGSSCVPINGTTACVEESFNLPLWPFLIFGLLVFTFIAMKVLRYD
jgi:hypothetical protein